MCYRIFSFRPISARDWSKIYYVFVQKIIYPFRQSCIISYLHQLNITMRFIATGHASFLLRTGFFKLGEKRRAGICDRRVRCCRPQLPPKQRGPDLRFYQRNSKSLWCKRLRQCKISQQIKFTSSRRCTYTHARFFHFCSRHANIYVANITIY